MYNISTKYNRLLFLLLKIAIVGVAFYYIYKKLVANDLLSFSVFWQLFTETFLDNIWAFIIVLLFTDANWILEIFKWKTLVSTFKKISFLDAYEQCFASHSVSIITPNRLGEYPAKTLFYKSEFRNKIIGLNLIGNLSQLLATTIFGIFGFGFFLVTFKPLFPEFSLNNLPFYTLLFIGISMLVFEISKRFNLKKRFLNFKNLVPTNVYYKTIAFSIARYIVFSHQYFLLLRLFGVETEYSTLILLIFTIYLLASIVPVLSIFDWVIKGSVALFIFQFIQINEVTILTVALLMWILNFAIPAIIGSFFVLNFDLNSHK